MRMNRKTRIGLLIIVACLIFAVFMKLFQSLQGPSPAVAVNNQANNVVAQPVVLDMSGMTLGATENIPERSIITAGMLKPLPLPRDGGAAMDKSLYFTGSPEQLQGFITARAIKAGDRVLKADLVGNIKTVGIAGALRPGFRAQIVPIPNKSTLHDLIAVGDYIDVIASFDGQESRTIVQNVRVLAVDVFGGDFPQVKIARRGDYKAPDPNAAPAPAPAPGAAPGTPGAAPTPTPTPEGPPPAKPDPAITIEVTPDQATSIALSQNSGAALDFILRPRPAIASVAEARMVALTKPRLAPYADRMKKNPAGNAKPAAAAPRLVENNSRGNFTPPPLDNTVMTPPAPIPTTVGGPVAPETYQIPVYGDGKITRIDTVRKPS